MVEIEVKELTYHRGTIPILKGSILFEIDSDFIKAFEKQFEKFFPKKVEGRFSSYLSYLGLPNAKGWYSVRFATGYTEFLYPGGPDLGYNLNIQYYEHLMMDDVVNALEDLEEIHVKKSKKSIEEPVYELLNKYVSRLNKKIYTGEKKIYQIIENPEVLENEIEAL